MRKAQYDFVVLGAGSAGIAAAQALAERYPNHSTLLVEQGTSAVPSIFSRSPLLQPYLPFWSRSSKSIVRRYEVPTLLADRTTEQQSQKPQQTQTEKGAQPTQAEQKESERGPQQPQQKENANNNNRTLQKSTRGTLLKGKGLGGSTLLDSMQCLRGTPEEYQAWGAPRWEWRNGVQKAFQRVHRHTSAASVLHDRAGTAAVSHPSASQCHSPLNVKFCEACEAASLPALGLDRTQTESFLLKTQNKKNKKSITEALPEEEEEEDAMLWNYGESDGFGPIPHYIDKGVRTDLFDSLIGTHRQRTPQLDVASSIVVQSLAFDERGKRCIGVRVRKEGETTESAVSANVAVISCLGGIESPLLLQRSGIGRRRKAALSASSSINSGTSSSPSLVVELPEVGQNVIVPMRVDVAFTANPYHPVLTKTMSPRNYVYLQQQWKEYHDERSGAFSSLSEVSAFVKSKDGIAHPDLQITMTNMPILQRGKRLPWWVKSGYTLSATHPHTRSRGTIEYTDDTCTTPVLRRSSHADHEIADLNALSEGVMWIGLLAGPESTLQSSFHEAADGKFYPPFHSMHPTLLQPWNGFESNGAVGAYVMESAYWSGDVYGGCAMGAVVDETLQVKGVDGLYVADASVVPTAMTATSRTVSLMIGHRVAEMVKVA